MASAQLRAAEQPGSGLIPHAQLKLYPDAAHSFQFQHHTEFAADVSAFLDQTR